MKQHLLCPLVLALGTTFTHGIAQEMRTVTGETEKTAFTRSTAAISGVESDHSDITWGGNYPADIKRIEALSPDLILTIAWRPTDGDQLRAIAPIVVRDSTVRNDEELYQWLANLTRWAVGIAPLTKTSNRKLL